MIELNELNSLGVSGKLLVQDALELKLGLLYCLSGCLLLFLLLFSRGVIFQHFPDEGLVIAISRNKGVVGRPGQVGDAVD